MKKLWEKNTKSKMHASLERFETADDLVYDNFLTEADIYGSAAHARMLGSIKILRKAEVDALLHALNTILKKHEEKEFSLVLGDEDIHTKIENELVRLTGDIGKKIHTGRSRNDQVLVDMRIFSKQQLFQITGQVISVIQLFIQCAQKWEDVPMPGYTHMQKAMPSSVGLWFGAYAESLADSLKLLGTAFDLVDQSPLGSGAAYGVNLPLDRQITADLLGFKKVQNNSLYCQNSRGKIESAVLFALMNITADISRFASDVLLFTTSEFNFFNVDPSLCTGSSIMPQKQNVDIAELLRSKVHIMFGYFTQVYSISLNLPSGYNRDLQDTKKPYMEAFTLASDTLGVVELLASSITPNTEVLTSHMTKDLYATSLAYRYVSQGIPFRSAYQKVGENLDSIPDFDAQKELKNSLHIGSTGNLNLTKLTKLIQKRKQKLRTERDRWTKQLHSLLEI
ncbi:argininosuccinate lyase [Candidatus Woesebacteria bacterium]|nr:argininosuccinate lyase [Candidatus Woesebacteria bacterium]